VAGDEESIALHVELTAEDARILRGALVAAQATERSELERRAARHSFGYGTDAARESMDDDVARHRRRIELLGRLLEAIRVATPDARAEGAERSTAPTEAQR
jgi:hypothetical protein